MSERANRGVTAEACRERGGDLLGSGGDRSGYEICGARRRHADGTRRRRRW